VRFNAGGVEDCSLCFGNVEAELRSGEPCVVFDAT